MNPYIEEMVSTGQVKPLRLIGTALAVFKMIQILAEYKPHQRDPIGSELWLINREN